MHAIRACAEENFKMDLPTFIHAALNSLPLAKVISKMVWYFLLAQAAKKLGTTNTVTLFWVLRHEQGIEENERVEEFARTDTRFIGSSI